MFWFFYNFCNIPLAETVSSWIFLYYFVSSNTHFHCSSSELFGLSLNYLQLQLIRAKIADVDPFLM